MSDEVEQAQLEEVKHDLDTEEHLEHQEAIRNMIEIGLLKNEKELDKDGQAIAKLLFSYGTRNIQKLRNWLVRNPDEFRRAIRKGVKTD